MDWNGNIAAFEPRAPWWGGDLQTIRNQIARERADLSAWPGQRLAFDLGDGGDDQMLGVLHLPNGSKRRSLALLLHGLTGCEDSFYMLATARTLLDAGYSVLRLNQRGSGPSRQTCRGFTHAGRSDDVAAVLAQLPACLPAAVIRHGIVAVGYSLGGNILLKYLGEVGAGGAVRAAISVSAPIDLAAAASRFHTPRNWFYHRWLLARIKAEATTPMAELTVRERSAVKAAPTVRDFDDTFLAPRHGFAGADDYYARCSAAPRLGDIAVPTLLIHARDDPWIPARVYDQVDWARNPMLSLQLATGGGHVGFHDRRGRPAWHDRCVLAFLRSVSA